MNTDETNGLGQSPIPTDEKRRVIVLKLLPPGTPEPQIEYPTPIPTTSAYVHLPPHKNAIGCGH
jgi:hypothetical protein